MRRRRGVGLVGALVLALAATIPFGPAAPVRAAEYTLDSTARYDLRPDAREVLVEVELAFTNTTPDPEGQFSIFDELRLAIHDAAADVTAADADGELEVAVEDEGEGIRVATIALREGLRFEESVDVVLRYHLADGAAPGVRIGPALVAFPAWGFGTSSEVVVRAPDGYEVRVDGDPLRSADDGSLTSGPISDPAAWLALVTAIGPRDLVTVEATVPLDGGTVDLLVRSFADEPGWGTATRDLVVEALPLLEAEIGVPYPRLGQLVLVQSVPADTSGFGEPTTRRAEIEIGYDQPPFTILHQLAHLWLDPLVETRWIAEGMASDAAARVAPELEVEVPFDPATEAAGRAGDAIALDAWRASDAPAASAYAHAAAWALVADVRAEAGDAAIRTILARTAASVGAYAETEVEPPTGVSATRMPLTSRTFLDQAATVAGIDLADTFSATVFTDADVALLPARAEARAALEGLVARADGWGAPDPVRAALTRWRFADAMASIDAADAWLVDRDDLLAEMERVGLSRPERLRQAFRSYGGGTEAIDELTAERAVVDAYAVATDRANAPRSFLARIGLLGGPDPSNRLAMANGRYADGDLRGSLDAINEATVLMDAAESTGIVRIVSLVLLVIGLAIVAIAVFRRRASVHC